MGRRPIDPIVKFFNSRLNVAAHRDNPHDVNVTGCYCKQIFDEQNGLCAISGEKLTFVKSGAINKRTYTNASIDRIDNSKGYVKNNIQIVSVRMNMWKSDLSLTKFKNLVKMINNQLNNGDCYESAQG